MKNKNKGFTLIELIVVLIIFTVGALIVRGIRNMSYDENGDGEINPQEEYVEPAPVQDSPEVEQLKIQNEILRKLVEQKRAEKP